ncbi:sugar ABC transporter permease, partial [Enterococcus faecalis]
FWTYQCSVVKLGLNRFFYPLLNRSELGKINHYCCQYVDWYSCYDVNLYRDYPKSS